MTSEKTPPRLGRHEWQPSAKEWETLKPRPRQMRKQPTPAERALWQRIRRRQIGRVKFRRQFAIDRFIVDFCSPSLRLVIEVDGPGHRHTREEDAIRQTILEGLGFSILRFTNDDVLNDIETVLKVIEGVVAETTPPPALPKLGEGARRRRRGGGVRKGASEGSQSPSRSSRLAASGTDAIIRSGLPASSGIDRTGFAHRCRNVPTVWRSLPGQALTRRALHRPAPRSAKRGWSCTTSAVRSRED